MAQSHAWRTASGKPIKPAVVRAIAKQMTRDEEALKLLEEVEQLVDSERPPAEAAEPKDDDR